MESPNSQSVLPPDPPYGSNWGHKIADFEFLPYISFIVAFIASECIKRYWESICGESYGSNWGHKIADFEFLPYISFIVAFIASECIKRYWESICGESK